MYISVQCLSGIGQVVLRKRAFLAYLSGFISWHKTWHILSISLTKTVEIMKANTSLPLQALLVDQPNVHIPYSAATLRVNREADAEVIRNTRPFSEISNRTFRHLFNRHATAFRR